MTLPHEQDDLEGCVSHSQGTNVSTQGSLLLYKEASEASSLPFSLHIPSTWRKFFVLLAWSSLSLPCHWQLQHLVRRFLFAVTYLGLAPAQPVQHSRILPHTRLLAQKQVILAM